MPATMPDSATKPKCGRISRRYLTCFLFDAKTRTDSQQSIISAADCPCFIRFRTDYINTYSTLSPKKKGFGVLSQKSSPVAQTLVKRAIDFKHGCTPAPMLEVKRRANYIKPRLPPIFFPSVERPLRISSALSSLMY